MKKALVIKSEFSGRLVGEVFTVGEPADIDSRNGNLYNNMVKVEVPAELEEITSSQLEGELIPALTEKWTKDGQADVSENPNDDSWTYVPASVEHWELKKKSTFVAFEKGLRITEKYDLMNGQVMTEMGELFKTTKSDSATRTYLTLMSMSDRPAKFAGQCIMF